MPVSQMRNGLTAGNSLFSQKPTTKVSKSKFDLSRLNCFTSDIGMLVPVDVIPTLPNDSFDLGCQYKIDFRPMVVPTLTAYKVKLHYYYCPNQYLWEGWESFISKGRSGNLSLTVPKIKLSGLTTKTGSSFPTFNDLTDNGLYSETYYPCSPHSLVGYMQGHVPYDAKVTEGVSLERFKPFVSGSSQLSETHWATPDVNALPYLMYQKIYRSNYMDPNLYSNGQVECPVWFPDDIDSSHWRFNYASSNLGGTYNQYFVPIGESFPADGEYRANFVPVAKNVDVSLNDDDTVVNLLQLRYSMYMDDMFTTALPFLQRGPQTMLDLDTVLNLDIPSQNVKISSSTVNFGLTKQGSTNLLYGDSAVSFGTDAMSSSFADYPLAFSMYDSDFAYPIITSGINTQVDVTGVKFSAQQLRSLLALSVWQERNALTNGSYGQFIKVHFDNSPNNTYCEPIYIGGTTSLFNINSILQTSESGSTPLGNPAGLGGSSNSSKIGKFYSPDYGFIMVLMSIIPDTIYSQVNEHYNFELSPDDYFMPEYEQLSYQPILDKQLYYKNDPVFDGNLFGYSNRYVYLKQRDSVARGLFGLPSSVDAYYHSYVQSRMFTESPNLNQQFVTVYPPNVDRSFLAYPSEPAFLVQFYSSVSAVRPMSYLSRPNTFGF
uniref:Major capsid protein n=1 Tax=Dulem virus 233 TaxID=3145710 RepID=A0AAU8AY74_9VIRU